VKAGRCFLQTVGVLVLFTVARASGLLGPPKYAYVSVGLLTVALVLIAWSAGGTRADLGLGRTDVRAGVRYGAGAFGVVLLVLIVAAVIPATNGFLHDSRAKIDGSRLLYELAVSIVLLTAIPEEFAFRGVLLGSALRLWGPWRASLITSALFGLWHIEPTLHTMSDNRLVAGASTSVGGQVLVGVWLGCGDIHRRSGLLLAQAAIKEPDCPGDGSRRDQRRRARRCVVYRPLGPSQVITTGGVCPVGLV